MGYSIVPPKLRDSNPNYLISLFGTDENGSTLGTSNNPLGGILSPMPEEFSIETVSTWHPLLDGILKGIANTFIGGTNYGPAAISALQNLGAAAGYSLTNVIGTQLVWEATSPVEFNLPLRFDAVEDAYSDVTEPIKRLLSLTLPSTLNSGNSTADEILPLHAPGPGIKMGSYHVNIAIGNMLLFTDVIVRSVQANFHTLPSPKGDFISADVNVMISTSHILTKQTLETAFKNRGISSNSGSVGNSLGNTEQG